jgi:hypothetical protein
MNKRLVCSKIVLRRFSFLRNLWGKTEEQPEKPVQQDKDKYPKIKEKDMPIKEDKINEYFRSKVKKFDGRLN